MRSYNLLCHFFLYDLVCVTEHFGILGHSESCWKIYWTTTSTLLSVFSCALRCDQWNSGIIDRWHPCWLLSDTISKRKKKLLFHNESNCGKYLNCVLLMFNFFWIIQQLEILFVLRHTVIGSTGYSSQQMRGTVWLHWHFASPFILFVHHLTHYTLKSTSK